MITSYSIHSTNLLLRVPLQVLIFPSPKCGTSPCSANVWMHVVGSRSETKTIAVPRGVIHFSFWAR